MSLRAALLATNPGRRNSTSLFLVTKGTNGKDKYDKWIEAGWKYVAGRRTDCFRG